MEYIAIYHAVTRATSLHRPECQIAAREPGLVAWAVEATDTRTARSVAPTAGAATALQRANMLPIDLPRPLLCAECKP